AGLYEKWSANFINAVRAESRRRLKQARQVPEVTSDRPEDGALEALSLEHLQGPMLILMLGWACALLVFCVEWVVHNKKNLCRSCYRKDG
ncbi:Ionotropic receptor 126, partial [Hyalella azteca]